MDSAAINIDSLRSKIVGVDRRLRAQRALDSAVVSGIVGAVFGAALLLWSKLTHANHLPTVVAVATLAPVVGALFGALRPSPQLWAAQLIDRTHDLHDRFASALSFADLPPERSTPFETACIRDALQHADRVEPKRAAPLHRPRWLLAWLMSASTIGAVALIKTPTHTATVAAPTVLPALIADDDLDAFRQAAQAIENRGVSPELQQDVEQLNQLLEQLAGREIDREQALRALRAMEDNLARASQAHPEALKDALATLGKSLERANATKTIAKALSETDPAAAAAETQRVSKQLRDAKVSKRDLEAMRTALARAAKAREGQSREQLAQRRQELERLLQREREQREQQPDGDRRLLNRRQRELERLQREEQAATEQERQLERLQRELDNAAENLSQDNQDAAADALDRSAEELNRMAREQMTQEQRQQLQQQIQQLREMLRRQQQSGKQGQQGQGKGQRGGGQRLRLEQFTKAAQGQTQEQPGQQGDGQEPGNGQKMFTLGQNGEGEPLTLELPGMQRSTISKRPGGPGQGTGDGPGDHAPGEATSLDADHVNTRVEGEQQAGPSRSQVIQGASSDGFAERGYQKVFTDYERHAESVIERDEIPGGYRFYVRRYFQLIRPRESNP